MESFFFSLSLINHLTLYILLIRSYRQYIRYLSTTYGDVELFFFLECSFERNMNSLSRSAKPFPWFFSPCDYFYTSCNRVPTTAYPTLPDRLTSF